MNNTFIRSFFAVILSLISLIGLGQGFSSVSEATSIARQIVQASGKPANFALSEAKVPNAVAVLQNGKRYVFYNPSFINKLAAVSGTRWSAVSVLAHEIGHHLNKGNKAMASELEADEFSGYILQKMGASLEEAQAAMKLIAQTGPSYTHPARQYRLSSIEKGWINAGGKIEENTAIASTSIPRSESSQAQTSIPGINNRHIVADLSFDADPNSAYFLTTRLSVIKVRNNQVSIIGKLSSLNDEDFPFVISDEDNNKVYVDRKGAIVNSRGRMIGRMKLHS